MRVMSNCVMVRVGGGWEDLGKFLERRAASSGRSKDYKNEARRAVDDILRLTNGRGLCSARTRVSLGEEGWSEKKVSVRLNLRHRLQNQIPGSSTAQSPATDGERSAKRTGRKRIVSHGLLVQATRLSPEVEVIASTTPLRSESRRPSRHSQPTTPRETTAPSLPEVVVAEVVGPNPQPSATAEPAAAAATAAPAAANGNGVSGGAKEGDDEYMM